MKKSLVIFGLSVALLSGCGGTEDQSNCPTGFTGLNCDQCAIGFAGNNCDECAGGYFGKDCKPCVACGIHGRCYDGKDGDGSCNCDERFTGKQCNQCSDKFTGLNCDQCAEGYFGENCNKTFGQITDSRDVNQYKTFEFANQTWMAENLRYNEIEHYSANNDKNNDEKYGYLYTWDNAMKACPDGWRLPIAEEFIALIGATSYYEFINLISIQDKSWVYFATNSTLFSALPAGRRWLVNDIFTFDEFGTAAFFWTSTPRFSDSAQTLIVESGAAGVYSFNQNSAFSVRCIRYDN